MINFEQIDTIRKGKRLTAFDLSKMAGINRVKMGRFLKGEYGGITLKEFESVCHVLGLDVLVVLK